MSDVKLEEVPRGHVMALISRHSEVLLSLEERDLMADCLLQSSHIYVGLIDDRLVCIFGLITPTLLSERAYLWLYTTPEVEAHKFIFVRYSQRVLEQLLKQYPDIQGHVLSHREDSKQWLRWLGAEFMYSNGELTPFQIKERARG